MEVQMSVLLLRLMASYPRETKLRRVPLVSALTSEQQDQGQHCPLSLSNEYRIDADLPSPNQDL